MGKAKQRKLARRDPLQVLGDVRALSDRERKAYIKVGLQRAKEIATTLPEGETLYAAFAPMLKYVVSSKYLGGCHDTSAILYMQLREAGLQDADVALCIGEVRVQQKPFDHSWVEVRGKVFDVAICAPNSDGSFAGGAVFAGVDLGTNAEAQAKFGVASELALVEPAATVVGASLLEFQGLQIEKSLTTMSDLVHMVYGVDGQALLAKYGNVKRAWRNPRLNP
ncbi:hypothetical protein Y603_4994 [Burkholderia pseudomallei MSHR1153]|nr:hypothetical protein Y603_4994 [Burkholderia pseudomallei MSHR1153]